MAFGAMGIGADCSPTPAACSVNGGVALECAAGRVRVCVNSRCARVMNDGQACRPDPCQANATIGVCRNSASTCVPNPSDPSVGTCQPSLLATTGYLGCDPNQLLSSQCPHGSTCEPRGGVCGEKIDELQNGAPGLCVLPAAEGQGCDGDFNDPNPDLCSRCESGTTCVMWPGETRGMCRRPCTTAADCPCGGESACLSTASGNFCRPCAGDGLRCRRDGNNDTMLCCKASEGSVCDASTDWRCCRPNAVSCTENGQCCGTNRCISGQCGACRTLGQSAANPGQCCAGLELNSGVCKRPCRPNTACTVPGFPAGSPCATGQVTACDGSGNPTCTPRVMPRAEECNGEDDNCNGTVDEGIARTTCDWAAAMPARRRLVDFRGEPHTACTNDGLPQQGVLLCERGAPVCTAFQYFHFCDRCGSRSMRDPTSTSGAMITTSCGACATAGCLDGNPNSCMPGLRCFCPAGAASCSPGVTGFCEPNPSCSNAFNRCWPRNPSGLYGPMCI